MANTLAGVLNGARQVEGTINGIGERAGNAALEEVVMAMRTRADYFGVHTGIRTREFYRTSRLVADMLGIQVPPNKAVVGGNAFSHSSGNSRGRLSARSARRTRSCGPRMSASRRAAWC